MTSIEDIKLQPHNIDAEKGVIAGILMDNSLFSKYNLDYTDFYKKELGYIYKATQELVKDNSSIDVITLSEQLNKNNRLDTIGGLDYLYDLSTFILTTSPCKEYAKIVKEKSSLRGILKATQGIINDVYRNDDAEIILGDIENRILDLAKNKYLNSKFNSNFKHIGYDDKISRSYEELLNTDPNKIIKRGWKERDNTLGGIYGGKIYIVGGSTGIGKSTFVNQVCNNVSKQGYRVVKYSLEDRMEDIGKEEIYYTTNRIRKAEGKKGYFWIDFVNGNLNKDEEFQEYTNKACNLLVKNNNLVELDKNKQVGIDDLVKLIEEECLKGTKLFAIDHLHYFDMDGNERHDLQIQNVMHRINEITRKYNIAVILVAHYRKGSNNLVPDLDEFKDGSAIKHVGNIIIQITRDEDTSKFHITKMRGPLKPDIIETTFNLSTFEYAFTKTDEQKKKEKTFI